MVIINSSGEIPMPKGMGLFTRVPSCDNGWLAVILAVFPNNATGLSQGCRYVARGYVIVQHCLNVDNGSIRTVHLLKHKQAI